MSNLENVSDCYNKYISLLADELFQFRKLAKEIHEWSTEISLERKIKALDRLEKEVYRLSISPESTEIINVRKQLSEAISAMEEHKSKPPAPSIAVEENQDELWKEIGSKIMEGYDSSATETQMTEYLKSKYKIYKTKE